MASTKLALELLARNRTGSVLSRFRSDIRSTTGTLRRLAGAALATAGVAGFGYMIKQTMASIDQIAKMSDELQISTQALTGWEHAASISGTSLEVLHKALEIFVRRMGEAKAGIGEGVRGLEMLGMTAQQLIDMGMEKAFERVADSISKMETSAEQAGAACNFFGRQGVQLLNMFQQGEKGIRDLRREADLLGISLTRIEAAKVEEANDALTKVKATFTGLFRQLTVELSPFITAAADSFTDWAVAGEGAGVKLINVFEAVTQAVVALADEIAIITGRLNALLHPIKTIKAAGDATKAAIRRYREISGDVGGGRQSFDLLAPAQRFEDRALFNKILREEQAKRGIATQDRSAVIRRQFDDLRERAQINAEKVAAKHNAPGGMGLQTGRQIPSFETRRSKAPPPQVAEAQKIVAANNKIISSQRARMLSLIQQVDTEIELLGRVDEPRQHARMMVEFQASAAELYGSNIAEATRETELFRLKLEDLGRAQQLQIIADGIGDSFGRAFEDMVLGAAKASEAIRALADDVLRLMIQQQVTQPLSRAFSDLFTGFFTPTATIPSMTDATGPHTFAAGGVFDRPTLGVFGEAGPETILPLTRGPGGKLGVSASGSTDLNVSLVNQTGIPMRSEILRVSDRDVVVGLIMEDFEAGGATAGMFGGG